ncbi:peptidylprolyl isomerase [Cryobacterium lactosi]|uniref:peptidylprolyl isomerase n=1 Tax=Cryobacterium lactosi TaxID=1259202 RepID=A0A4R9BZI1_9MICO|nr:peptidylprolyl isomerase [Cryobacterium lactosi]TFD93968.1 peptidylprolyl isomerase [Cryobacterium lactosi]
MAPSSKQEREAREARGRVRAYQARKAVNEHQAKRRTRDNILAGSILVVVLAVLVGAQLFYFGGGPGTPEPSASGTPTPTATPAAGANTGEVPDSDLAEDRTWTGTLTLNDIPLGIELDGAAAPQAVSSTISLVQSGFYDGLTCHRLTNGGFSVLQCGDPSGDGTGGPGYSYGPIENAPADNVYPAGTLAMARAGGDGYSTGSQFFIVYADTTIPADEAGGYTVIGQVTSGLDQVVSQIAAAGVADGSADGAPLVPATITSFSVQ